MVDKTKINERKGKKKNDVNQNECGAFSVLETISLFAFKKKII